MTIENNLFVNQYARKPRPMKAIVIGAGISGIAFTYMAKGMEGLDFVIYEKNPEVTGTWYEARYPGVACDIPSHSYTFSWQGNPNWSKLYVSGEEIFQFFRGLAEEYGVYEKTKLEHKVVGAKWIQESSQWEVTVENLKTGETIVDHGDVLMNCSGVLNKWDFPNIKGLKTFQGPVIHTAKWEDSTDLKGKRVAVIGSGASGIQVVPAIYPDVSHLVSFNRSANWVAAEFASELATEGRLTKYSEEEKKRFREDPDYFLEWRKKVEHTVNCMFELFIKDSPVNKEGMKQMTQLMRERLGYDDELCEKLIPDFHLGCRRVTPGYNYLETLVKPNVDVVTSPIKEVSGKGLHTEDGNFYDVDIIITATGYDTTFVPRFPLIGIDGVDLRDRWADFNAEAYLGVCVPNYPNYFMSGGPNSPLSNGSLLPSFERQVAYCLQVVQKLQIEGIKYVMPKKSVTDSLNEQLQAMMGQLAFTSHCSSWYKTIKDGKTKVIGPWPGSGPHYMETIATPRYEDFEYVYQSSNPFQFLGNGYSYREGKNLHLGWYVR